MYQWTGDDNVCMRAGWTKNSMLDKHMMEKCLWECYAVQWKHQQQLLLKQAINVLYARVLYPRYRETHVILL